MKSLFTDKTKNAYGRLTISENIKFKKNRKVLVTLPDSKNRLQLINHRKLYKSMNKLNMLRCRYIGTISYDLKMKLLTFLFMAMLFQINANTYSQNTRVTIDMERVKVEDVLTKIEQLTEFKFFVDTKHVDLQRIVSVRANKKTVSRVLNGIFTGTDITFEVFNKQIILKRKVNDLPNEDIGLLNNELTTITVQFQVSGTVTDEQGVVLPGANIVEKGTTNGVVADFGGNFSMNVSDGNAILEVSYIGFATKEIAVNNQTTLNVKLEESAAGLDEVVVVGYGTQRKETLTGSVSQINGKDLQNRVVSNVASALQGEIPNVNISVTDAGGEPGATPNINIRGYTSISGGSPLIIIDGIEQSLDNINPSDIETVTVFKDAASTAIYGTRAAFGVINITTKRGKDNDGKVTFSINSNTAMNAPTQLPAMANSVQFLETIKEAYANSGAVSRWPEETLQRARQNIENPGSVPTLIPFPSDPTRWGSWGYSVYASANTDWYDVFYKTRSFTQMQNISMSGGSENVKYYVSAGYYDEDGKFNFGVDGFQHYNLTTNIDVKINNWLKVKFNNRYSKRDIKKPHYYSGAGSFEHGISKIYPTIPILDPNGNIYNNALLLFSQGGKNRIEQNQLVNSTSFVIEPVKGWEINAEINFRQNFISSDDHHKTVYRTLVDNETKIPEVHSYPNYFSENMNNDFYNTNNIYSSYNLKIDRHDLTILGGFQSELYNYKSLDGRRDNIVTDDVPSISTATGQIYLDDSRGHWSTLSYFGRINYSYADKYLLEIVGRYNGSSKFPEDRRWSLFPAVSLGYNISNEEFWGAKLKETISLLKFRFSYGENGNQDVPNYLYLPNLGINQNLKWITNNERPIYITAQQLISPNVGWETVRTSNFGIDAGFFKNRLNFNFDYYKRETLNMFGPSESLPAVLGASAPTRNNANLSTKGFEAELNWSDQIEDFGYNVRFTLSNNNTTITHYQNETGILNNFYEGMKIGEIWGYTTKGINKTDAEAQAGPDQSYFYSKWGAGDIQYVDLNGDGKIDPGNNTLDNHGDLSVIGNNTPHYSYGLNLGLQWKNFDFSIFWQGVGKRDILFSSGDILFWGIQGNGDLVLKEHLDYWSPNNPDAYYPKPYKTAEHYKNTQNQSGYIQDASYLRLKNLQIGFSIPKRVCQSLKMDLIRLYFTGENLITFTNMASMFDPEVVGGSWGAGKSYPISKTMALGLNVKF